jgi:hypothetical protein
VQVVEQQQQQLMMVTLSRPISTAQSADAMQGICGMLPCWNMHASAAVWPRLSVPNLTEM